MYVFVGQCRRTVVFSVAHFWTKCAAVFNGFVQLWSQISAVAKVSIFVSTKAWFSAPNAALSVQWTGKGRGLCSCLNSTRYSRRHATDDKQHFPAYRRRIILTNSMLYCLEGTNIFTEHLVETDCLDSDNHLPDVSFGHSINPSHAQNLRPIGRRLQLMVVHDDSLLGRVAEWCLETGNSERRQCR